MVHRGTELHDSEQLHFFSTGYNTSLFMGNGS